MIQEKYKYSNWKKKKVDTSFSKKINFYKKVDELPKEIGSKELKKFVSNKPAKSKKKKNVFDNVKYDSTWEADYAKELEKKREAGEIAGWRKQQVIEINVITKNNLPTLTDKTMYELKQENIPFTHICNYWIDFIVSHNNGTLEFVEVKGAKMEMWVMKFRLFESIYKTMYPQHKLTIIR